jgi:hypothetical protein
MGCKRISHNIFNIYYKLQILKNEQHMYDVCKKNELLFCFVDLHPHLFVQRGNFVSLAGVLGYLIIQILNIGCSCLELAVHTDILALKRYHGVSPALHMRGYIFIHFGIFKNCHEYLGGY